MECDNGSELFAVATYPNAFLCEILYYGDSHDHCTHIDIQDRMMLLEKIRDPDIIREELEKYIGVSEIYMIECDVVD
jgi:hypothetical protein